MVSLAVPSRESKFNVPIIDAGNYQAYLVTLATLGLQEQEYQGEVKDPAVNVLFQFEVIGQSIEDKETGEELPRVFSKTVKFMGGEKANLTKILNAVDPGLKATNGGQNLEGLLGKLCSLEVVKKEVQGKPGEYRNYAGPVGGKPNFPGDYQFPERRSETLVFSFDEPEWDAYLALPFWAKRDCKKALNFPDSALQRLIAANETQEGTGDSQPTSTLQHAV